MKCVRESTDKENLAIYRLLDSHSYPIFEFRRKDDDSLLKGTLYWIIGWKEKRQPIEYDFIADIIIKWDLYGHWNFFGYDYGEDDEEIDGYYYICGGESYIEFMQGIAFVCELAMMVISNFDEKEITKVRKLNLLDGCTIVKVEEDK